VLQLGPGPRGTAGVQGLLRQRACERRRVRDGGTDCALTWCDTEGTSDSSTAGLGRRWQGAAPKSLVISRHLCGTALATDCGERIRVWPRSETGSTPDISEPKATTFVRGRQVRSFALEVSNDRCPSRVHSNYPGLRVRSGRRAARLRKRRIRLMPTSRTGSKRHFKQASAPCRRFMAASASEMRRARH
jgi:hypothetical protein